MNELVKYAMLNLKHTHTYPLPPLLNQNDQLGKCSNSFGPMNTGTCILLGPNKACDNTYYHRNRSVIEGSCILQRKHKLAHVVVTGSYGNPAIVFSNPVEKSVDRTQDQRFKVQKLFIVAKEEGVQKRYHL